MQVNLDEKDIQSIAEKVLELLKPHLPGNGSRQEEDDLLTVEEVAILLKKKKGRKGRASVYQLVNNAKHGLGSFPYMKAGRGLLFSKQKILEWMKDGR